MEHVTIYGKPTQVIATLILIGGVIGILVQPMLGKLIDKLGERTVLMAEAVLLIPVCLAYGFSKSIFSIDTAFLITCACYLIDQVLVSVSMARSTYMKKIALQEADIQPAISASITIDHFFSIGIALIGVVTASFASWLIERVSEVEEESEAATRRDIAALTREVQALRQEISRLRGPGPG